MSATLPRLRDDLVVHARATADGEIAVVKDPVNGEFYRFAAVEYFILRHCDGATPIDVLRRRAEAHFGGTLADATLTAFVAQLDRGGLFETATSRRKRATRRARLAGSALYLRYRLFDPTRLFDRMLPHVRWCFTPWFVATSALVIVLAVGVLGANWALFTDDVARLIRLSSLPLAVVIVFLLVMAHEFAHGLACRHFGGSVRELGLMLIYFQPACYCNVSDAWLFPERAKRLLVSFAGPYFELCLWALAVIAWRVTAVDTWANHLAIIVIAGSGVKTLLNFNPLIKFDGYYLLSDWLDIPNLRKKSFRYVGDRMRAFWESDTRLPQPATSRERHIYFSYGAIATVYSFSLMAAVSMSAGELLISHGQPVALAFVGGLVGLRVRRRIRGLMGGAIDDDEPDAEPVPAAAEPAAESAADQPPATPVKPAAGTKKRRRRRRRIRWRRATLLGLAGFGALTFVTGWMEFRVAGPVVVLPEENADVRAEIEGIIERVLVDEGDSVRAGEVIARLSGHALLAELRATEAELREMRATLRMHEAGPTVAEIEVARAAVSTALDHAAHGRRQLAVKRALLESRSVSRTEVDDAQAAVTAAEHAHVEAQSRLDVLLAGTRAEVVEAARARIDRAEASLRDLERQRLHLDVVTPVAGVVATPARELHALRRQLVSKGGLVAKVYSFDTVTAHLMISEKDIGEVRPGQEVEVRTLAYPNHAFSGVVTAVAIAADGGVPADPSASPARPGADRAFVVRTRIDNRSRLLKPGMTGQGKVFCGPRRIAEIATRRMVRMFKVEVWSWW